MPANVEDRLRQAVTWGPYVVVFAASACGLIIEIVAARILAPSVGVSLYTWTTVIGVVLAGISVGNYLGGRVADRYPSPATLGFILLAGGISSLMVLVLVGPVSDAYDTLALVPRIVLMTVTLFFLPSLILGAVTPMVIKLRLTDLAQAGSVAGRVYAIATAGSIFGTFITGFVLIQTIGARETLLLVAVVLIVMALAMGQLWRVKTPFYGLMAVIVGLASVAFTTGAFDSGCLRESNYYCIQVTSTVVEGNIPALVLQLDRLQHTTIVPDDPTILATGTSKIFAEIEAYVAGQNPGPKVLFIGGGGYLNSRYVATMYPESDVEVIEIDPEVTQVATKYLGLPPDTRIVTYNEDARIRVPKLPSGQYDLVIGDAFWDISIPFQLTTKEFNESVSVLLKENGIYAINVVDKLQTGRFLRAYVNTLRQTFPYLNVIQDAALWEDDLQKTYVVVASFQPLTANAFENAVIDAEIGRTVSRFMPEDTFEAWFNAKSTITLTDNFAPVDNLTAPNHLDSASVLLAVPHYNTALVHEAQGRLTEAIVEYGQAVRYNPGHSLAYMNRGILFDRLGQPQRALEDLEATLKIDPRNAVASFHKGAVFIGLGEFQKAIQAFDEAVRVNPEYAEAYVNRGSSHIGMGQFQQAIEDVTEAIQIDPEIPLAYVVRAFAYTGIGADAQAEQDLAKAAQMGIDPAPLREEIERIKNER